MVLRDLSDMFLEPLAIATDDRAPGFRANWEILERRGCIFDDIIPELVVSGCPLQSFEHFTLNAREVRSGDHHETARADPFASEIAAL
jgi:hypothetical protein